ncbi:hypothetical protein MPL1_07852 [Methylophaga lonarensis MPL]|uniref:Ferritin-like domain-containing protein n=1 Tax=Methylophaga lonarensis MPL TaxID=1286106 RepID=M7P075_9GAMM|nr:ferritin-like domain-containing protein [Methylophaga lonarensis]EMR12866.1 hypothetical protein MPL1_07852 [Methylophaga lonarensis MPL]
MIDIRQRALDLLLITAPEDKVQGVAALFEQAATNPIEISRQALDVPELPGRPAKPDLVAPRDLPRRRNNAELGHAALIHAITHIEFNAINLALDAIARFADLPEDFYRDWLRVAAEEATHFTMLNAHLAESGKTYGDFPAHDGMWEMARKTHHDPLIRMALVPRVLEARGLDVTPKMMDKLRASGDLKAVEILELILREEIGHVAVGTRWFNYLCDQRQLEPLSTFSELLNIYFAGELRGPFHDEARKQAGFTDAEMAMLNSR